MVLKTLENTFHPVKVQLRGFIRVATSNIFVQTQQLRWKKLVLISIQRFTSYDYDRNQLVKNQGLVVQSQVKITRG